MIRPSWDAYWIDVAYAASTRSTCSRLQVGAVLVRDNRVLGTGYNGRPRGFTHCVHEDSTPCSDSVHAEVNAIIFAQQSVDGATLYSTHLPCLACAGTLINAGVTRCVYNELYRESGGGYLLLQAGVELTNPIRKEQL